MLIKNVGRLKSIRLLNSGRIKRFLAARRKSSFIEPRFLSINSHVVSGYVGNKCTVFTLQLLGFDVDFINSVQFSNRTGYKCVKGQVITEKELADLITGLQQNKIDSYSYLLTGYIGSPGFLKEIVSVYKHLKTINPDLIYVCDPVMGDNGKLYVPEELLPIYKESILPIATVLVPNLFEIELLTDIKIETEANVWEATEALHTRGIETVFVSSAELPLCVDKLYVFASSRKGGNPVRLKMDVPKLPAVFAGSGDLFSALILCFLQRTGFDLKESLERTMAALQAVLKRTFDFVQGKEVNPKNMELRLIQSRDDILNPNVTIKATIVE